MIDKKKLLADPQGRQFKDVLADPEAPVQELLDLANGSGRFLSFISSRLSVPVPGLAVVVREFEQIDSVRKFFSSRTPKLTVRFRQLAGVVIRIAAEEQQCVKTGQKGYLRTSRYFKKAEIYKPGPNHPDHGIWQKAQ